MTKENSNQVVEVRVIKGPREDGYDFFFLDDENPVTPVLESVVRIGYDSETGRGDYDARAILQREFGEVGIRLRQHNQPVQEVVMPVPIDRKVHEVFPSAIEQNGPRVPRLEIGCADIFEDAPRQEHTMTGYLAERLVERD